MLHYNRRMRRLYVFKRRLHHGFTGCLIALIGLSLIVHDRKDASLWFKLERLV